MSKSNKKVKKNSKMIIGSKSIGKHAIYYLVSPTFEKKVKNG